MTLIVATTKRAPSNAATGPPVPPGPAGEQHVMQLDDMSSALCGATGLFAFGDRPYSPNLPRNRFWCGECREKADALYGT